jgi:hypothetical protein
MESLIVIAGRRAYYVADEYFSARDCGGGEACMITGNGGGGVTPSRAMVVGE